MTIGKNLKMDLSSSHLITFIVDLLILCLMLILISTDAFYYFFSCQESDGSSGPEKLSFDSAEQCVCM